MSLDPHASSLVAGTEVAIFSPASQRAHSHAFNSAGRDHPVAGLLFVDHDDDDRAGYELAELEDLILIHRDGKPSDLAAWHAARGEAYVREPDEAPDEDDDVYVADEPTED